MVCALTNDLIQCGPNPGPRTTFVRPSTTLTVVACLVSRNTTWSVKIILRNYLKRGLIRIKNERLTELCRETESIGRIPSAWNVEAVSITTS